jgi:hypothetical protein
MLSFNQQIVLHVLQAIHKRSAADGMKPSQ